MYRKTGFAHISSHYSPDRFPAWFSIPAHTRHALIDARHDGIHPFCITIDTEARDYLPHMYGAVNWTLVEDVRRLPHKVSDIYRRLTA